MGNAHSLLTYVPVSELQLTEAKLCHPPAQLWAWQAFGRIRLMAPPTALLCSSMPVCPPLFFRNVTTKFRFCCKPPFYWSAVCPLRRQVIQYCSNFPFTFQVLTLKKRKLPLTRCEFGKDFHFVTRRRSSAPRYITPVDPSPGPWMSSMFCAAQHSIPGPGHPLRTSRWEPPTRFLQRRCPARQRAHRPRPPGRPETQP